MDKLKTKLIPLFYKLRQHFSKLYLPLMVIHSSLGSLFSFSINFPPQHTHCIFTCGMIMETDRESQEPGLTLTCLLLDSLPCVHACCRWSCLTAGTLWT